MNKTILIGCAALSLAFAACDDDDEKKKPDVTADAGRADTRAPGAGGINLGLDKNKRINQLTPEERTQACEELQDWSEDFANEIAPKICRLAGVLAVLQSQPPNLNACGETVSRCSAASMTDAGAPPDTNNMCGAAQANCTATVGEVEKCTNDNLTVVNTYLDAFPTCAQLAAGTGSIPAQTPTDPPSCTAIKPKCPQLPLLSELLQSALSGRMSTR